MINNLFGSQLLDHLTRHQERIRTFVLLGMESRRTKENGIVAQDKGKPLTRVGIVSPTIEKLESALKMMVVGGLAEFQASILADVSKKTNSGPPTTPLPVTQKSVPVPLASSASRSVSTVHHRTTNRTKQPPPKKRSKRQSSTPPPSTTSSTGVPASALKNQSTPSTLRATATQSSTYLSPLARAKRSSAALVEAFAKISIVTSAGYIPPTPPSSPPPEISAHPRQHQQQPSK